MEYGFMPMWDRVGDAFPGMGSPSMLESTV